MREEMIPGQRASDTQVGSASKQEWRNLWHHSVKLLSDTHRFLKQHRRISSSEWSQSPRKKKAEVGTTECIDVGSEAQ